MANCVPSHSDGHLSTDMSRPSVIHLDFPALPRQDGKRVSKLAENGKIEPFASFLPLSDCIRDRDMDTDIDID